MFVKPDMKPPKAVFSWNIIPEKKSERGLPPEGISVWEISGIAAEFE
jgi:hypothetical protein